MAKTTIKHTNNQKKDNQKAGPETTAAGSLARSRFIRQPARGLILGARDAQLLADVFLHQMMTRSQVQALHFTSTARCNARLRQLFDWKHLTRFYLPESPYGAQAVYSLGEAAVPVVARHLEMEEADIRSQLRSRTPSFRDHTLAIVAFYLALRQAMVAQAPKPARSSNDDAMQDEAVVRIERWLPEMLCRHDYDIRPAGGGKWQREIFRPDAFVRLAGRCGQAEGYRSYFVEIDRGHTSSRQFAEKLFAHHRYLESGLFAETFGTEGFHTLVVTTSVSRLRNLLALIEQHQSQLFWFTTFDTLERCGALAPIWQVPFAGEEVSLR